MDLVAENMKFIDFKDFYKRRRLIKHAYDLLSPNEKQIYKLYVYSNRLIVESKLNKIWEALNEPFGSVYYIPIDSLDVYL